MYFKDITYPSNLLIQEPQILIFDNSSLIILQIMFTKRDIQSAELNILMSL